MDDIILLKLLVTQNYYREGASVKANFARCLYIDLSMYCNLVVFQYGTVVANWLHPYRGLIHLYSTDYRTILRKIVLRLRLEFNSWAICLRIGVTYHRRYSILTTCNFFHKKYSLGLIFFLETVLLKCSVKCPQKPDQLCKTLIRDALIIYPEFKLIG